MREKKKRGGFIRRRWHHPNPSPPSHHAPLIHPHLSSNPIPSYPLHPVPCLAFSLAGYSLPVLVLWLVCVFLLLAVLCWWCCFVLWLVFFVSRVLVLCVPVLLPCPCVCIPGFLVVCPVCVCVLSPWFAVCLCCGVRFISVSAVYGVCIFGWCVCVMSLLFFCGCVLWCCFGV